MRNEETEGIEETAMKMWEKNIPERIKKHIIERNEGMKTWKGRKGKEQDTIKKKLSEINDRERGRVRTELQSVRTDKGKAGGRKKEK